MPEKPWASGERVRLVKTGTVSYTRSGFAFVRWDDGTCSSEWAGELEPDHENQEDK